MTTPNPTGAVDAELEDWGPLEEATGAPMATHGVEIWVDGDASAGTWDLHETVRKVYSIF